MATPTKSKKKVGEVSAEDFDKKFGYVLFVKNDERGKIYDGYNGREVRGPEYKPRQNILLRSTIIWDGSDAVYEDPKNPQSKLISGHKPGRQIIRYFDGCPTLFEDEQLKMYDRETINRMVDSTKEYFFQRGYFYVQGNDTMLKQYMDICSWNADSEYRVPTVQPIFKTLDVESSAVVLEDTLDALEEALTLAKKASESKMLIHAEFLGVELVDPNTTNPHTTKVIRAKYREAAMKNPSEFVKTYNDDSIQIEGWLKKALLEQKLSTTIIPNQAVWKNTGAPICDISGLKTQEGILNKLIEFTKSNDGEFFKSILEKEYK
jgi:hypothetical protein